MSLARTLLLGLIAGGTILLGMPAGRLRRPLPRLRAWLNAAAVGILLFLIWDVLSKAWEPIAGALVSLHGGRGGLSTALGYGLLFASGLSVGLLSLVGYEAWMARALKRPTPAGRPPSVGPGAMSVQQSVATRRGIASWPAAKRLSLLIAVGIGLHNFAEGLAIGQSAASGQIALATLLVIGFALHNATEGFGIVAPLTGDVDTNGVGRRPSWPFLLSMAAIGGGPTFVGTAVGHSFTSEPVSVIFMTLAAGSILFVVIQLLAVAARSGYKTLVAYGLLVGLLAGFLTDAIISAGGA
jgi:zinc transporter, ZIP family